MQVKSDLLPEVTVRQRSYSEDSLQNRQDYAKVFNYHKPRIGINATDPGAGAMEGVGFDLDALIDIVDKHKKKEMLAFQHRLVSEEQDSYVDHKFNKSLVKQITGLDGDQLDTFMKLNRPSYSFIKSVNDYDFYQYIKDRSERFKEIFSQKGAESKTP